MSELIAALNHEIAALNAGLADTCTRISRLEEARGLIGQDGRGGPAGESSLPRVSGPPAGSASPPAASPPPAPSKPVTLKLRASLAPRPAKPGWRLIADGTCTCAGRHQGPVTTYACAEPGCGFEVSRCEGHLRGQASGQQLGGIMGGHRRGHARKAKAADSEGD